MNERIGWIGTGVMGEAMCGHLLAAGHAVHVHSRTRARAEALLARGAQWADTAAAAAAASDVVFTMVGSPAEIEAVLFGASGVLSGLRRGALVVDMGTSPPALARRLAEAAAAAGADALDAPVSGGDVGAREATLAIMVGGEPAAFARAEPLLRRLGRTITRMGGPGSGQHTKMCNQILIASTMIGVVESLLYAARSGLDATRVIDVVSGGAAASWSFSNLGRRIARGDYAPGFCIKHFVKDMGIALEEAQRMQLVLPGLELAAGFYREALAQGLGESGTQALHLVLARLNAFSSQTA